jgi:hypothetical protein
MDHLQGCWLWRWVVQRLWVTRESASALFSLPPLCHCTSTSPMNQGCCDLRDSPPTHRFPRAHAGGSQQNHDRTAIQLGGLLRAVSKNPGFFYRFTRDSNVDSGEVSKKGRILLANLFQGSRSTLSRVSFPSVFAFQAGMWGTPISTLLNSPIVPHEPRLSTAYENSPAIFRRVSGRFLHALPKPMHQEAGRLTGSPHRPGRGASGGS